MPPPIVPPACCQNVRNRPYAKSGAFMTARDTENWPHPAAYRPESSMRLPVAPSGIATTMPPAPRLQAPGSRRTLLSIARFAGQGLALTRTEPVAASGTALMVTVWKFTSSASGSTL